MSKNYVLYPVNPKDRTEIDCMLFLDKEIMTIYDLKGEDLEQDDVSMQLKLLESSMGCRQFVADKHKTLADYCLLSTIAGLKFKGIELDEFPNIESWLKVMIPKKDDDDSSTCYEYEPSEPSI